MATIRIQVSRDRCAALRVDPDGLILGLSNVPALDWLVPVVRFLPFTAGGLMMATQTPDFGPEAPDYDFFNRWASGGIFAIFVVLILGLAWVLFLNKDA